METAYLSGVDWRDLEARYPAAYHFLLTRTLDKELFLLRRETNLNEYRQRRLTELENWKRDTSA